MNLINSNKRAADSDQPDALPFKRSRKNKETPPLLLRFLNLRASVYEVYKRSIQVLALSKECVDLAEMAFWDWKQQKLESIDHFFERNRAFIEDQTGNQMTRTILQSALLSLSERLKTPAIHKLEESFTLAEKIDKYALNLFDLIYESPLLTQGDEMESDTYFLQSAYQYDSLLGPDMPSWKNPYLSSYYESKVILEEWVQDYSNTLHLADRFSILAFGPNLEFEDLKFLGSPPLARILFKHIGNQNIAPLLKVSLQALSLRIDKERTLSSEDEIKHVLVQLSASLNAQAESLFHEGTPVNWTNLPDKLLDKIFLWIPSKEPLLLVSKKWYKLVLSRSDIL